MEPTAIFAILLLGVGHLAVAVVQTRADWRYRLAAASTGVGVLLLLLPEYLGDGSLVPWGIPAVGFHCLGAAAGLSWHTDR